MRLSISQACFLFLTSAAPAAEMSVWVVRPDDTVLSTHTPCERTALRGDAQGLEFVVASGFDGVYTSLHTSPDGSRSEGGWSTIPTSLTRNSISLFSRCDGRAGEFYLGTLYVQIR